MADEKEIIDRAGVGDDKPHVSKAQSFESCHVAARVFDGVVDPDLMRFQETVEFVACIEAKKAAQFSFGDVFFPVFLESKPFERAPGQIAAGSAEPGGDVVGNLNSHIHQSVSTFSL